MCDNNQCEGHVVPCGSCNGTGKESGKASGLLKCTVCRGVGSVLLTPGKR